MALLRVWLARLKSERTATLCVALLLFVTSLAVALAPRALEREDGQALVRRLVDANSVERALVIHETAGTRSRLPTDWANVMTSATRLEEQLPAPVRRLVADRRATVETAYWQVHSGPAQQALLRLRLHDGAFERIRLDEGRLPTERVETVPDERFTAAEGQQATVYEALLPASAAERLGVGVGDVLPIESWRGDSTNLGINLAAMLRLVGTYELAEPESDFWIFDVTVAGWRIFTVGTNDMVETSALLAPEVYSEFVAATHGNNMTLLYQYRFLTDTTRLSAPEVAPTMDALRRLAGNVPRSGISDVPTDTRLNTGLLRLLEGHQRMWQSTAAIVALVGMGVLVIAVASLAAVLLVASAGRIRVAALLRARGAAARQVLGPTATEMAGLAAPSALLALIVALIALPGPAPGADLLLVALVALLAVVIGVLVVNRATNQATGGRAARGRRPSARRLVLEVCLVAGALGGAWLLRERGINALNQAGGGADLLPAIALALVGVAAGVLAMRVYPLPARSLETIVALRRDLLPVLAARRAVRGGSSGTLLFLLVGAATVGTFALATLLYLERSAELGAWHSVGAEHRIGSPAGVLPAALEPGALPGVEAHASGTLRSIQVGRGNAWLLAIEPADWQAVVVGTPAEVSLPGALTGTTAQGPVPVLSGNLNLRPGTLVEAGIERAALQLLVVEVSDAFPGVPAGEPFVVAGSEQLAAAIGRVLPPNHTLLRAPPEAAERLREAAQAVEPSLVVESRSSRAEAHRSTPAMGALRSLLAAGSLLAIGYAAVAAAAALALSGAAQRDEVAHLRAIGLSRRGPAWLTLVEYGPAAFLGYLAGLALGLALLHFLMPALGLAAITGSTLAIPVTIEAWQLATLLAAALVILAIGWLASVLAQRDTDPASAIRRGVD